MCLIDDGLVYLNGNVLKNSWWNSQNE